MRMDNITPIQTSANQTSAEFQTFTDGGALLMDGIHLRDRIVQSIRNEIVDAGTPSVCLATVLVGDDRPSRVYVQMKQLHASKAAMKSQFVHLDADTSQADLENVVHDLARDANVHGILVQLPLPEGLDSERVLDLIPPEKDVDGLTERSLGRLVRNRSRSGSARDRNLSVDNRSGSTRNSLSTRNPLIDHYTGHVPCTPLGVMRLLEFYNVPLLGRRAVVIGRSPLVGLPQMILLSRAGVDCTPTLAHSRTENLAQLCKDADIIVSAAGVAGLVTSDFVKPGATLIDVGISRSSSGIVGDIDIESCMSIASAITPMPGGTGPMTIACLLENTLSAAKIQKVLT